MTEDIGSEQNVKTLVIERERERSVPGEGLEGMENKNKTKQAKWINDGER